MIALISNQKINQLLLIVYLLSLTNIALAIPNVEWEKEGGAYSFTISANDSIVLYHTGDSVRFLDFKDGSLIKTLKSPKYMSDYQFSKDGNSFAFNNGSAGGGVGFMDYQSFVVTRTIDIPNMISYHFVEDLNLIAAAGSNFIKIINANTGAVKQEFPITHYRSLLFQDNLSVCYSKTTNLIAYKPLFTFNSIKNEEVDEVRIIDTTGKIVFERETKMAASRIAISNSGNYLAYFFRGGYDSNYRLKVIDLRTMLEVADFKAINDGIRIYFTFDDKYVVVGYQNGLTMHNLETLKTTVVFESSTSISIVSPKDYLKTLYWNLSDYKFYKLSLPLTSINQEQNKIDIQINIIDNKLILTNPQNHQINILTAYDILGRTYPLSANGNEVDVSALSAGKYFLKVGLADGSFLDFSFVVE